MYTHRLLSSSFLGLPYGILNINHKKELLRSLWVGYFALRARSLPWWTEAFSQSTLDCKRPERERRRYSALFILSVIAEGLLTSASVLGVLWSRT